MTKPNLAFYAGLLESMQRSIAGFQEIVDRERAAKEEAIQSASELEEIVAMKATRIAELEAENAQLKTGFEAVELTELNAIGEKIEELHNSISNLHNPIVEVEETEEEFEIEEFVEASGNETETEEA
jgi:flagellar biosynthesis/type III secretory pathway chaperone